MATPNQDVSQPTPQGNFAHLMKTGVGLQLVLEHGLPIAPSEVTKYLASIDERLFMASFPFPQGPVWALGERWSENDRRWQSVQSGETPRDRAFDVIGYPPNELKLRSAEDAAGYLTSQIRKQAQDRPEWQRYIAKIEAHNAAQTKENHRPVIEYAQELAAANTQTMFADQGKTVTKVFQSEPTNEKGTKRTKGRDASIPLPTVKQSANS